MQLKQQLIAARSWEDRYRLIIQAAKNLTRPSETELNTMQLIAGCEAKLWFKYVENSAKNTEKTDRTFCFQAFSEARIVNGLLWILLQEINHKSAKQLRTFDVSGYFSELGIAQRLSSTRLNGLKQIEKIIQSLPD